MGSLVAITLFAFGVLLVFKRIFDEFRRILPANIDKVFENLEKYHGRDMLVIQFFFKKMVFLHNPELIHKVLNSESCIDKANLIYKFFGVDNGVLTEKGERSFNQ
jgi:hypothetical protein